MEKTSGYWNWEAIQTWGITALAVLTIVIGVWGTVQEEFQRNEDDAYLRKEYPIGSICTLLDSKVRVVGVYNRRIVVLGNNGQRSKLFPNDISSAYCTKPGQ